MKMKMKKMKKKKMMMMRRKRKKWRLWKRSTIQKGYLHLAP